MNGQLDRERIRALLPEFLLGTLPADEAAAAEAALREDPALQAEADELAEVLASLTLALPPVAPPPALRERLLASLAADGPLARFAHKVAALFDVTVERARDLLGALAAPASWVPGPCPGTELMHVRGGPRVATADVGFVRLQPGARFPHHSHGGLEEGLMLQGGYQDSDGTVYRPGDTTQMPGGSSHEFTALPGEPCIFAVVVFGGVRFDNGFQL